MKVLILHSELGVLRGGGENFTRSLFVEFAKRGHNVAVAFAANLNNKYPIPMPTGIRPIPIGGLWLPNFGQAQLSFVGRWFGDRTWLRKQWDLVQQGLSWRTFAWHKRRFQRRIQRKFSASWSDFDVVYVHGDPILANKAASYRPTVLFLPGPVSSNLLPELVAIQGVCSNGDALLRIRGFLGNHALELPVGLNHQVFAPGPTSIRQRLGWSRDDTVIGYVGRLHHIKGVDLLSSAFKNICKTLHQVRLVIVGQGEEIMNLRSDLAEEISRGAAHIEPDVEHETLPEWYRAMDLVVMPSRYENFSNALLEAMACEIPFLGSNVGGNKMMAEVGAGWLFESESVSSLSASLQRIIKDRAGIRDRGKVGRGYVQQFYSWARSAEVLETIINSRLGVGI